MRKPFNPAKKPHYPKQSNPNWSKTTEKGEKSVNTVERQTPISLVTAAQLTGNSAQLTGNSA